MVSMILLMNTRIKAMKLLKNNALKEQIEMVVVMKVKSDYLNYDESDIEFEYEGIPISIQYNGMQAYVEVQYPDGDIVYQITFNDLDECIMNFEYSK